ncbi:MAG: SDR family oxidoreductase [Actinomycetota bacterium]|nr:SDR family oxidoreductase [Actinomycetota bacterium]
MTPNELFDLTGKVAIVTGGAGDIGRVYARALCETGSQVVLADVKEEPVKVAAGELEADGFAAIGVAVDVTRQESTQAMAASAVDAFGGIDILINNAAIMVDLPPFGLSNMPVDEWDRVMGVNFKGPLLCTQAVVPSMTARGGGRIVNGLSAGGFMKMGGIYGVSKLALHGLTANLASELGPLGINVNAIAPGLIDSDSGYASLPKDSPMRAGLEMIIPGKKSGPPGNLIGTLLLLCSAAGDWINGQSISVDGGWIMRL